MYLWLWELHSFSSNPVGCMASWSPGFYHLGDKDLSGDWPLLIWVSPASSHSPVAPRVPFQIGSTHHLSKCLQEGLNEVSSECPCGPSSPLLHSTRWASPLSPAPSFLRPPTERPGAKSGSYLKRDDTVDFSFWWLRQDSKFKAWFHRLVSPSQNKK